MVNGKKYCARRSPLLNLYKIHDASSKPVKQEDNTYKCPKEGEHVCGNPKKDTPASRIFCVPKNVDCPITDISFDKDGKAIAKMDADLGMPIINLQLSQKGAPCIYNN